MKNQETNLPGNAAAMREALARIAAIKVEEMCECADCREKRDLRDIARAALSAPPRNCDVGTAKEQAKRWNEFCSRYFNFDINPAFKAFHACDACPLKDYEDECMFAWLQMPFEKGTDK